MAHYKPHFSSHKQHQKQSQKINQLLKSADYQNLVKTLCPRHDQEGYLDELLPSLSNDQKYALGLAFYKLHQPRKALSLWAGLVKKRGEDFDNQVKNLVTSLLGQWDTDQNRAGASLQLPWSPAETRGLYTATKNLIPTDPRFPSIKNHFLNILWNQGQTLIAADSLKPVECPSLHEITKILAQGGAGDLDTLINLTQCQFWTRRNGNLEAKFNLLNQYLTIAASLVYRQKPTDFIKSMQAFVEAFFEWYGPTLGSNLESMRALAALQVSILDQVSQLLYAGEPNHLWKDGVLWSPGSFVRGGFVEGKETIETFRSILPSSLAFFYTEAGFSLLAIQSNCDRSLTKIDQDQFTSTTYLRGLIKAGNTYGFLSGLVLLAQKSHHSAMDFLVDLDKEGLLTWNQNELERYLRENLQINGIWSQSAKMLNVWLYLIKSCPNLSNDPSIDEVISHKVHLFLQKDVDNKSLCTHCLNVLSENLPTGPLKKLVTKTILKLEESENLINDIESGGFQIETPTGLFGRAKIGPKAYFIKLVDAYLNTSPLVGFWNRPNRCRFISNLGIYVESVRLNKEIRNQLDALFLDDYYSSSAGLENFRIGLEKIAPSLGCSMDLAMLLAIGKNSLSSSKSTNPEEIVFGKNAHYLTNPYRILGFDSQPTKQQVMAAVLQQMKKNPQDLVTIRLAQSSLFDALSGPVFAFLYCFHRSAADLETKATQHKEVPVNRSPNLTETAGGAV